jgi:hypothetical protein
MHWRGFDHVVFFYGSDQLSHTHIGTTELSAVGNLCDGGRVQFGRPETSGEGFSQGLNRQCNLAFMFGPFSFSI